MYTTVLSLGAVPSLGSRCTNALIRSAVCHSGSRNTPSIVIGCPMRTARTCCGAVIGESAGMARGSGPTHANSRENVVPMGRPADVDVRPRLLTLDGERAVVLPI